MSEGSWPDLMEFIEPMCSECAQCAVRYTVFLDGIFQYSLFIGDDYEPVLWGSQMPLAM